MILSWLKATNTYLYAIAAVLIGVGLVFNAGQRSERNANAAEVAAVNAPIVEQRGKDEAELAAEALAAEMRDRLFASAPRQVFILDEETARALK